jgi:hypothetical protein
VGGIDDIQLYDKIFNNCCKHTEDIHNCMELQGIHVDWNKVPHDRQLTCKTLREDHQKKMEKRKHERENEDMYLRQHYTKIDQYRKGEKILRREPSYQNFQNTISTLCKLALDYIHNIDVIDKIIMWQEILLATLQNFEEKKSTHPPDDLHTPTPGANVQSVQQTKTKKWLPNLFSRTAKPKKTEEKINNSKITIDDESNDNEIIAIILIFEEIFNDTIIYKVINDNPPQKDRFIEILRNISNKIKSLYNSSSQTDQTQIKKYKDASHLNNIKTIVYEEYQEYNDFKRTIAAQQAAQQAVAATRSRRAVGNKFTPRQQALRATSTSLL